MALTTLCSHAPGLLRSFPRASDSFTILLRTVSAFIVSNVKQGKKVFVADNAHSLSVQTWGVLRNVFNSLDKNFLLILGQRSASKYASAEKICMWLKNSPRSLCLHLRELSKADTASLVCAVLEASKIPRPLATAIFDKCKGHPRFIMEMSELLLAEEKVVVEGGTCRVKKDDWESLKLPNTIKSVMVSRLDQLSSSQQITLKVASVIGPVFSLTLVCDIYPSGANKQQIADDIAALLRERFVQTVDQGGKELLSKRRSRSYQRRSFEASRKSMDALLSMKFVFLSETLRELAYEQLTFSIRRTLHKKIAEWYEYTYSKADNL